MNTPLSLLPYLNLIAIIFSVVISIGGSYVALRYGRQSQLSKFQETTITAQEATVTTLKLRLEVVTAQLEEEKQANMVHRHNMETIADMLAHQFAITLDITGDVVTLTDQQSGVSTLRKRRSTPRRGKP